MGAPEATIGFRLWHVHHQWLRFFDQRLAGLNLTHLQFVLLAACHHLALAGEVPSQSQLAGFTAFDKMMVSKALRLLEAKGYLKRRRHPADPRAKRIDLTAQGGRVLHRAKTIAEKALADFFGVLGTKQRTLSILLQELMTAHGGECPASQL
jgi:DNA-binding MarR family transcriptional regulator